MLTFSSKFLFLIDILMIVVTLTQFLCRENLLCNIPVKVYYWVKTSTRQLQNILRKPLLKAIFFLILMPFIVVMYTTTVVDLSVPINVQIVCYLTSLLIILIEVWFDPTMKSVQTKEYLTAASKLLKQWNCLFICVCDKRSR